MIVNTVVESSGAVAPVLGISPGAVLVDGAVSPVV
jgi:hypothetical protein